MAGTLLRLRGLPFSATPEDVSGFFEGYSIKDRFIGLRNGKPTGEAYVEFESADEASRAMRERQHENMGSRYIEIFVAGEADLLAQTSGAADGAPSLSGHVVRLRGLPFNSTAADVVGFFEGVDTVGGEAGIVFTCTPDGRPTGEAYVELGSADDLAAALAKHKEKIGARYIEIFESSKGDMYQAVQQHGYFTSVGGRRRHHWHQHGSNAGGAAAASGASGGQYPVDPGAGGGGGGTGGRGRGSQMDEMASAFAGFGLSQRDMQVPGPPRWGAYGAPADQQYQQYAGIPPRQMQQAGAMMVPGQMRAWRPGGQVAHAGMQHFNPAPGPPPGKGTRSGMPNGSRQPGGGSGGMMGMGGPHGHDYSGGSHGHGQAAMMFNPFMMQHPLMVQHHQQQHHGSAWGTPGMMQQQLQGGTWYSGMQMGRSMHAQMGMGTPYSFSPGYFAMGRAGPQMGSGSGHGHHHQHSSGGSRQHPQGMGSASSAPSSSFAGAASQGSSASAPAPAAGAAASPELSTAAPAAEAGSSEQSPAPLPSESQAAQPEEGQPESTAAAAAADLASPSPAVAAASSPATPDP